MVADIFDKLLVRMDPCLISKSMKSLALLNLENYNFAYRNLNIHKIKKKTVTVNKILKASHIVNIYSSMGNLKKTVTISLNSGLVNICFYSLYVTI